MSRIEFVREHPRNLLTFTPKQLRVELPEVAGWLDSEKTIYQLAQETGIIIPTAEEVIVSQGGKKN